MKSHHSWWILAWFGGSFGVVLFANGQTFNEAAFNNLKEKLEQDALELGRYIEELYATRCADIQLEQCAKGNYDDCLSLYPNQQCLSGANYAIPACGNFSQVGNVCAGLFDLSITSISIPAKLADGISGNPTNPQVIVSRSINGVLVSEDARVNVSGDARLFQP